MKIAFIDPANNSPFYNFSLLTALEDNGCVISFFTSRFTVNEQLKFDKLRYLHYFFFRVSTKISKKYPSLREYRPFRFLRGMEFIVDLTRLYFYLRNADYKIVHIHWTAVPMFTWWFIRLLARRGIKIVYTVNNIYKKDNDNGENAENKYVRKILYYSDRVIVFTQKTKDELLSHVSLCQDKVKVVPHGNYDIFRITHHLDKKTARRSIGLAVEKKVLLFFGRVETYKGLIYLINALNIVKEKESQIYLLIVGKFNSGSDIEELITRDKLESYVMHESRFIPFRDVEKYFVSADVIVMPYIICTHSGIHYMAYSFGKPVIATSCGELAETIEYGKSGFLVPPKNEKALSDFILKYFKLSENEQSEMSKYCLKIAEEKYSWQPIARKLMEVYNSLIL